MIYTGLAIYAMLLLIVVLAFENVSWRGVVLSAFLLALVSIVAFDWGPSP